MNKIAIDIGYGDVKVKTSETMFKFPSVYSVETIYTDFNGDQIDVGYYRTENRKKQYIVGRDSILEKQGFSYVYDYKTLTKMAPFFVYHAIQLLKNKGYNANFDSFITGLTLREWDRREEFFNALRGIDINNEVISFDKKYAFKQGEGIYFNNTATEEREEYIAVLDIGYNTVDVLLFQNGNILKEESFVNSLGVERIIHNIRILINQRYKSDISESQTRLATFSKSIKIDGVLYDLTDIIRNVIEKYTSALITDVVKHFRGLSISKVIVSGGGAYFLEDIELPKNFVLSQKPYEFQNVIGYYDHFEELTNV